MPLPKDVVKFGTFVVTGQVFHITPLSFALVNLKPLLPGHVLVSPRRIVPRFNDLSAAEVQDLFMTVQRVSRTIERVYHASALNIAIQDGVDAGQSVPHVHTHIIPRKKEDLPNKDDIYQKLEGEEGDLARQLRESKTGEKNGEGTRGKFPAVDADEERKPRSEEVMQKEAEWLAGEMERDAR
ncbi:HIT-like protein [Massarina eburnea CBS 473.64]|uniref:Bis(5'-adenosyl)-triphosphatase n=1 Tax=Massarina eburnea CBS 473.64 TaxID=1395130 RepID=A0A6A6RQW0_9PLEO|nr:HIT-like protein [Massarina eburnea CBS 473.64]